MGACFQYNSTTNSPILFNEKQKALYNFMLKERNELLSIIKEYYVVSNVTYGGCQLLSGIAIVNFRVQLFIDRFDEFSGIAL